LGDIVELEDLKVAWAKLDDRVAHLEEIVVQNQHKRVVDRTKRVLAMLGWGQAVQSVIWIGVIAIVAPFWIEHRHVPHLLAAGLALHVYGVLTVWCSVVQLLSIAHVYWTAPVVSFQRRLAGLERLRIISSLATGTPWLVLWVPALMVGAKRFWSVDLYAQSSDWIYASLGVGIVAIAAIVWLARRLANRPPSSPCLRSVIDDLAGRSLVRASRQLKEISAFGRD
jgi:hypothetical protein